MHGIQTSIVLWVGLHTLRMEWKSSW